MIVTTTPTVGGRAGACEDQLKQARQAAMDDMIGEAVSLGGNAVSI